MVDGMKTTLKILDTSGNEDYIAARGPEWFSKKDGFVFVYSVTDKYSFQMIPLIFEEIAKVNNTKEFPIVLVGTQVDRERRVVTRKNGKGFGQELQ